MIAGRYDETLEKERQKKAEVKLKHDQDKKVFKRLDHNDKRKPSV